MRVILWEILIRHMAVIAFTEHIGYFCLGSLDFQKMNPGERWSNDTIFAGSSERHASSRDRVMVAPNEDANTNTNDELSPSSYH